MITFGLLNKKPLLWVIFFYKRNICEAKHFNLKTTSLSYLIEQAGGKAITTGMERILDIEMTDLHQRSTIVMGSPDMVDEMKAFVQRYSIPAVSKNSANGLN